jgi:hypothetical protein
VSHQPERKEKDCLNCGAEVQGRYCHRCGQENIVTQQSFWSLTKHFVYDIFHFDGKFFDTLKYLLIRPGKVPREYINGKRMHFLDPIRMYLFTSAIFFLVFFSISKFENFYVLDERYMTKLERYDELSRLHAQLPGTTIDSVTYQRLNLLMDTTVRLRLLEVDDTMQVTDTTFLITRDKSRFVVRPLQVNADAVVDKEDRNWMIEKTFDEKWDKYRTSYGDDPNLMAKDLINAFIHKLPYLLFVSLPFFALILKLLYRRNRSLYYSDHAIFTLYHYIFSFILLLFFLFFNSLKNWSGWGIFDRIATITMWLWPIYLFIAMKYFYGQRLGKTLGKFLLVNFFGIISLLMLFSIFILLSVFQL